MALCTLVQLGDARKGAVFTEFMAIEASFNIGIPFNINDIRVKVESMVEIHGLLLFGIKDHRKNYPSYNQRPDKTRDKKEGPFFPGFFG
jgi:hypothetical protein